MRTVAQTGIELSLYPENHDFLDAPIDVINLHNLASSLSQLTTGTHYNHFQVFHVLLYPLLEFLFARHVSLRRLRGS